MLRLDLNNEQDRKFLEKRLGKKTLSELLSNKSNGSNRIIASLDKELQSNDHSSSSDDMNDMIKRSKYGNKKTLDQESGITFDSKHEAAVYRTLRNFQDQGKITDLRVQHRANLIVENTKICAIVIDFTFCYQNEPVYCDAKSVATSPPAFKIKMKMFEAIYKTKLHLITSKQKSILDNIREGLPL